MAGDPPTTLEQYGEDLTLVTLANPGFQGQAAPGGYDYVRLGAQSVVLSPTYLDPTIRGEIKTFSRIPEMTQPYESKPGVHDWGAFTLHRVCRLSANMTAIQSDDSLNNIDDGTGGEDTAFSVNLAANRSFWFWGGFFYNSGTTPDIKFHFTGPSGWAAYAGFLGLNTSGTFTQQPWNQAAAVSLGGSGADAWCYFFGTGSTGATAGQMVAQYAQNTSTASDTQMLTPSWLMVVFR